jgi:hypothetical protein
MARSYCENAPRIWPINVRLGSPLEAYLGQMMDINIVHLRDFTSIK